MKLKQFSNVFHNYYHNNDTTSQLEDSIRNIKIDMNKLGIYITTFEILIFLNEYGSNIIKSNSLDNSISDFMNEDIDSQSSFSKYYSCFLYHKLKDGKIQPNNCKYYCSVCLQPLNNNNSKCTSDFKCDNLLCNDCICGLPEPSCENCYINTYKNKIDMNYINEQLTPLYNSFNNITVKNNSVRQKYSKFIVGSMVENV